MKNQAQSLYFEPEQRMAFLQMLQQERKLEYFESTLRRRDGEAVHVIENAIGIFDDNDRLVQIHGYMFDITEHKKLEEQLRQTQKIKAIGQLAGGVAHDFNNTLMAITGYCDLLLMKLDQSDPSRQDVLEIQKAAAHGASLTRQLLAFSRKQIMATKVLDLNQVIVNMHKMLAPLIGAKIELVSALDPRLRSIKADPGQIEQVIVNLAVNARDAMPDGGKLIIETTNVHLDEAYVRLHPDATPGHYVMLTFADTGCGMNAATQSRIFEPFFTTKELGTGLGLATVHGIIHQSGGHITVQSETEKGSTFRIYLPAVSQQVEDAALSSPMDLSIACWQTVLLVDDNESTRAAVASFLRVCGFKIFEAANGHEALEVAERLDSSIDVLLTDIVMPRMNGQELARRMVERHPRIKILYMTGYTEEAVTVQGSLRDSEEFIVKPFPMRTLVNKIHQLFS
jgi:two-component system, cell cycle sensor histidine kinase and response regulator CckA